MKRITCMIFLLCTVFVLSAQESAKTLVVDLKSHETKKVLVVAHRGDWRNAPENSLQAFQNCIAMGVDMIEIDLKMTKDNQLVIMHDNTIDRTTDGKGKSFGLYVGRIAKVSSEKWIGKSYFSSNSDFGGGIGTDKRKNSDKHR